MDDKVYTPEVVPENPFPGEPEPALLPGQPNPTGTFSPTTDKEKTFPKKRTAVELLSTALNTRSKKILQEFTFAPSGSIQIGDFKEGIAGDLRLTPNGITARDIAGLTTFAIDGTTGDGIFKGEIRAGSLVSGQVIIGDNAVIIDGEERTIIVNDGSNDRVLIGKQVGGF
jgi:hypothetical protein